MRRQPLRNGPSIARRMPREAVFEILEKLTLLRFRQQIHSLFDFR
jgi:hypothetical protein